MPLHFLLAFFLVILASAEARVFEVGPGRAFERVGDAPLSALRAGDTVLIHARLEPYREKFVLVARGTLDSPVVIRGVPDPLDGSLPRLVGDSAVTASGQDFWSEARGIIKVGGANIPAGVPSHVRIERLDISGARAGNAFTDDRGNRTMFEANAAGIFVEQGTHVTIRECILHNNGNGLFVAWQTSHVLVEGNRIHDNGNPGSIYEHNSYTEAAGTVFQFNDYGPLCAGCPGNNLKDRSAGTVIRFNRFDGGNRQLDLVESDNPGLIARPDYRRTDVVGNLLIERSGSGNRQVVHYGGDGEPINFRQGVLHFAHNTVWSDRSDRTTLIRLSSAGESAEVRNNVVHTLAPGSSLEVLSGEGVMRLAGNWLPQGWVRSFDLVGTVREEGLGATGAAPGWVNSASEDFRVEGGSALRGLAVQIDGRITDLLDGRWWISPSPGGIVSGRDPWVAGAFATVEAVSSAPRNRFTASQGPTMRLGNFPGWGVRFGGSASPTTDVRGRRVDP